MAPRPSFDLFLPHVLKMVYISRAVGIPLCFAVSATHYAALDVPWYLWIPPLYHALVHPHLMYWGLKGRPDDFRRLDYVSMYAIEAVLVGHYMVVMKFALWPCFTWFGGYAMNNLSYGGMPLTARSGLGCLIGILVTGALIGFEFQPETSLLTSVLCFGYVLFYTGLLANLLFASIGQIGDIAQAIEASKKEVVEKSEALEATQGKLREQNVQLQEVDRQKTRFFQNISHELRTPLTLILNPLDDAVEEHPDDTNLVVAAKNARRLLRLVNQLLDFQKLGAGKKEIKLEPVDLVRFAWICGDYFRSACSSKAIDFAVEYRGQELRHEPHDTLFMRGQVDALEKVVFNFLSNALKYTPYGGRIRLELRVDDGVATLAIRDSGPGIAPEDQDKLFKVFSQIDDSTTRQYEGTGLGLALARELAEQMQGEVGVDSVVGEGSCFWARFPTVDAPGAGDTGPVEFEVKDWLLADATTTRPVLADEGLKIEEPVGGSGELVLVVDDLSDMRDLIGSALRKAGYRVITAVDGGDGLATVRKMRPDLVVTDWMMPVMHGPALIKHIRNDPRLSSTPVVLLTAKSDEESKLIGTEIGADVFLGKPFNNQELTSTVRNLMGLKAREREVASAYEQLKRTQAELVQAQKMSALGQMVAGVAHEINNPTNFLQTNFEVIHRRIEEVREKLWSLLPDDEDGEMIRASFTEDFDVIAEGATHHQMGTRRITDIVSSLRSFARHDESEQQHADLHEILDDTLVILGSQLTGIALEKQYGNLPLVACNPGQIGQVFLNLLSNAIYAARLGGSGQPSVIVRTVADKASVRIEVIDSGPGIDPEVAQTLFDPFVTTKPVGEGTGMGLAISWNIVQAHGGAIEAGSVEGLTTLSVVLPVRRAAPGPSDDSTQPSEDPREAAHL